MKEREKLFEQVQTLAAGTTGPIPNCYSGFYRVMKCKQAWGVSLEMWTDGHNIFFTDFCQNCKVIVIWALIN